MTTDTSTTTAQRVSRAEAARRLGVSEHTIDRYTAAGTLPAIRTTIGRRTWIDAADVERVRVARLGLES